MTKRYTSEHDGSMVEDTRDMQHEAVRRDSFVLASDYDWMRLDRDAHHKVATRAMDRADRAEARLKAIRDARLEWAMVCECPCAACDVFYDRIREFTGIDCDHSPTQGVGGKWECFKCGADLGSQSDAKADQS